MFLKASREERVQGLRARAALVGGDDPHLYRLLSDVLSEAQIELPSAAPTKPDVVLTVIDGSSIDSVTACISTARDLAADAPVIALLPIGDDRLAKRCIQLGVQGCWALDTPLSLLGSLLTTLVVSLTPPPNVHRGRLTLSGESNFKLGPQARALLGVLREQNLPERYPNPTVGPDAEERIERAVKQDLAWQRVNARELPDAFRFGVHARLEVTLMRLTAHATSLIERAIQADIDAASLAAPRERS